MLPVLRLDVAWAVLGVRAAFAAIATSVRVPTAENLQELLQAVSPKLTLDCMVLTLAVLILLVAGQVGLSKRYREAHPYQIHSMSAP